MAKVKGTSGKSVTFEVRGVSETISRLKLKGIQISKASDIALVRAATFIEEETKDSVAGRRAEPRSVDTGKFINSIKI